VRQPSTLPVTSTPRAVAAADLSNMLPTLPLAVIHLVCCSPEIRDGCVGRQTSHYLMHSRLIFARLIVLTRQLGIESNFATPFVDSFPLPTKLVHTNDLRTGGTSWCWGGTPTGSLCACGGWNYWRPWKSDFLRRRWHRRIETARKSTLSC